MTAENSNNSRQRLILVHGWNMNRLVWQPLIRELGEQYEVQCLDLPGHGGYSPDSGPELDQWLDNLLQQVAPGPAHWLGWSLGGLLCLALARRYPERVSSLVLLAATPCFVGREHWPAGMAPEVFAGFQQGLEQAPEKTAAAFNALMWKGGPRNREQTRWLTTQQQALPAAEPWALRAGLTMLRDCDFSNALPALPMPGLMLLGQEDALVNAAAGGLTVQQWAGARLELLPDTGHLPMLTCAGQVADSLGRFFAAAGSTAASPLSKAGVRRAFGLAAASYDAHAGFQRQVADQLLGLLRDEIPLGCIVDLGCGTGYCSGILQTRGASPVMLDIAEGMLRQAREVLRPQQPAMVCADAERLPLAGDSVDLLVSNLALQWCQNFQQMCRDVYRSLSPGGRFLFSTLAPGTLDELRQAWAAIDDYPHVNDFLPTEAVTGALREAGFERIELRRLSWPVRYDSVLQLMHSLKGLGARNAREDRARGLRGKSLLTRLQSAYPGAGREDSIRATYEVLLLDARRGK